MENSHCTKLWAFGVTELVFNEDNRFSLKNEFEGMFRSFGDSVEFLYYKSFQRVLIVYDSVENAAVAFNTLQGVVFHDSTIILEQVKPLSIGSSTLALPTKTHNFLTSPPPSPPMGWESTEEPPPVVDYNLIAAMTRLRLPGDPQYVFNGDGCVPSIVVSCMDEDTPTDHPHHPTIASARIRTPHPSYT